jgi:cell division control protein 6
MRQNKPQRLSLICILRSLKTIDKLDASTRSTLQSNIINLQNYSEPQLVDILNERVSLAFKPSAVSEETVNLIADVAFSENGNARFGIELLWRAGKYANADSSEAVTPECVRKAVSSIVPTTRKSDLVTLGLHEKLLLLAIARLFKENQKANISLTEAEKAYAVVCEEFETSPNSHTQLWKYLKNFTDIGIIEAGVSGTGSRGRFTAISLPRIPAHELEEELKVLLDQESMKP